MKLLRQARLLMFAVGGYFLILFMAIGQLSAQDESARPFRRYLSGLDWAIQRDTFSQSLRWCRRNESAQNKLRVIWRSVDGKKATDVRELIYSVGPDVIADVTVVQVGPDSFLPVMKWSCASSPAQRPAPVIHRVGNFRVLVIDRDFGGNIPDVEIWAWTLTPNGPVRLRVSEAVESAINRVAPGHAGYRTSLDWTKMHLQTWTWSGEWPGKIGVKERVDAWFTLTGKGLQVRRVEFRADDGGSVRRWPR